MPGHLKTKGKDSMIGKEIGFRLVVGLALAACAASAAATETCGAERYRPRLFKQFGEDLGYQGEEVGAFAHYMGNIVEMTADTGRGPGGGRGGFGGGQRGGR